MLAAFYQPDDVGHDKGDQPANGNHPQHSGEIGQDHLLEHGLIATGLHHDLQTGAKDGVREIDQLLALRRHADAGDSDIGSAVLDGLQLIADRLCVDPLVLQIQPPGDFVPMRAIPPSLSGLFLFVWYILIGIKLLKLGSKASMA